MQDDFTVEFRRMPVVEKIKRVLSETNLVKKEKQQHLNVIWQQLVAILVVVTVFWFNRPAGVRLCVLRRTTENVH